MDRWQLPKGLVMSLSRIPLTSRQTALAIVGALVTLLAGATDALAAPPATATFPYTGTEQTYTVPAGTHLLRVTAIGGMGGSSNSLNRLSGGFGGRVSGTLSVTPGQTLYVNVGGNGANDGPVRSGFNGGGNTVGYPCCGGGGGGASDVRTVSGNLASRLLVAGGGGGGGNAGTGGNGGFPAGQDGQLASAHSGPGLGATGTSGGSGGGTNGDPYGTAGGAGTFGQGGDGGTVQGYPGGGGGGGYFGGGGAPEGGGGGGSSYAAPDATDPVFAVDSTATPSVTFEALGLTPAAALVTFAQTPQQMLSAGQDVTFVNDGSVSMHLGAMRLGGANTDDFFMAGSSSCEGDLAPGDSCSLRLRFSPSALGARSATLTLHAQALGVGGGNVATTVALSGTGGVLPTGQNGINGTNGTNGTDGANGKDGAQGPAGKDGTNGTNGVQGTAGKDGAPDPAPPTQTPAPTTPPPTTQLLTVSNARSAALAKAKQLWHARKATVISVHRVSSSNVNVRLAWRTKAGKRRTWTLKVRRTSWGVQAFAAA